MTTNQDGAFAEVAWEQLDKLERGSDAGLYNAAVDACELALNFPEQAQARSSAVQTATGIVFRLPIAGFPPYKVFWKADGPRIEAIFPHP